MNKIFSERLKLLRLERGLSLLELSKELGISNATICRWETAKNDIKSEQLIMVAKYFGVSADYLIGIED